MYYICSVETTKAKTLTNMKTQAINFNQFSFLSATEKANFINAPLPVCCPVWQEKLQSAIVSQSTRPLLFFMSYPQQHSLLLESYHAINEVNFSQIHLTNQI